MAELTRDEEFVTGERRRACASDDGPLRCVRTSVPLDPADWLPHVVAHGSDGSRRTPDVLP